jgi:6-phospho-beta-glucosidase
MSRKIALIGGGGVRTPLLIHGFAQSRELNIGEFALFDCERARMEVIAKVGREVARRAGAEFRIETYADLEQAARGAEFIFHSIRVGGIEARARDERLAIEHGLAGQETTGAGGVAMALRTAPVVLEQAQVLESVAPEACFISFTNPAGLIAQALALHTKLRAIGICDTPSELFHRIADALGESREELEFDYAGLNHLGWIRAVRLRGEDITGQILADDALLRSLYPARLFDPELIQTLRLIPSEYLFFYYSQRRAYQNQLRNGASRGEELVKLNDDLFAELTAQSPAGAVETYKQYLRRRNASYMKVDAEATSAFAGAEETSDPFETATGYHRIGVDVVTALLSDRPTEVVVNVPNRGAIADLELDDVVEVACEISNCGLVPRPVGRLPESVRGLVLSVKAYERAAIRAAAERSGALAELAMLEYPIIGQWELARSLRAAMMSSDPRYLGYLR